MPRDGGELIACCIRCSGGSQYGSRWTSRPAVRGRSPMRTSSRPVRSARPTSHQVASPPTSTTTREFALAIVLSLRCGPDVRHRQPALLTALASRGPPIYATALRTPVARAAVRRRWPSTGGRSTPPDHRSRSSRPAAGWIRFGWLAPPVTGHCAGADSARFCRASPWSRQAPPLPVSARTAHPRCRVSTRPAGIALAVLCSWCVPSLEVGKAPTALLDDIHGRRPGFLREYFQDGDREVPHVVAPCRPPPASLPVPPLSPRARTIALVVISAAAMDLSTRSFAPLRSNSSPMRFATAKAVIDASRIV